MPSANAQPRMHLPEISSIRYMVVSLGRRAACIQTPSWKYRTRKGIIFRCFGPIVVPSFGDVAAVNIFLSHLKLQDNTAPAAAREFGGSGSVPLGPREFHPARGRALTGFPLSRE